jgi:hypothetical protein
MSIQKIKTGCVEDNAITTSKFLNQSVTIEKLATSGTLPALDGSQLTGIVAGATITKDPNDPATDTNPSDGLGALWLNTTQGYLWVCTDSTIDSNVWQSASCGTSNVSPYVYQGTQFGYVLGGFNGSYLARIEKYSFASTNSVNNIGDLSDGNSYAAAGYKHITHGFIAGGARGAGSLTNSIRKYAYSNETTVSNVGQLTTSHSAVISRSDVDTHSATAAVSSSTHGHYYVGSPTLASDTSRITIHERFSFVQDGDSSGNIGDIDMTPTNNVTCCNSDTKGYYMGGNSGIGSASTVNTIDFASLNITNDVGTLNEARSGCQGTSSTTHGFAAAGELPGSNYRTLIDKISFSSGNSSVVTHGNLATAQNPGAAASETTTAYYGGGHFISGPATTARNDVVKFSYASNSISTDHVFLNVSSYGPVGGHV